MSKSSRMLIEEDQKIVEDEKQNLPISTEEDRVETATGRTGFDDYKNES